MSRTTRQTAAVIICLLGAPLGCRPAAAAAGPASSGREPAEGASPLSPIDGPVFERGAASYYADSLAGHPTASGEPYDPAAFTAAHRTLPFGTWVEVVRKDGRRVRVRINDRGPFKAGRVIDVSRAAAEALGMVKAGVVDVELRREH